MRWGLRWVVACCGCGISVEGVAPQDTGATPVSSDRPDAGAGRPTEDAAAALPSNCVSAEAFKFDGDPTLRSATPGVVVLSLKSGKRAALEHTFDAKRAYARTVVDLLLDVDWQNTWGGAGNDYVPLLHQYFGPNDAVDAKNDITMAQNVLEMHIRPSTDTYDLNGMSVPKSKGVHVVVETSWSAVDGKVRVTTTPGTSWPLNRPTLVAGVTSTTLTLEIGGTASGKVPDVTIGLHQACVTFDP